MKTRLLITGEGDNYKSEDWKERLTQASQTAASVTPLAVGSP